MIIKSENNLVFKNKTPFELEKSNTQIENIKQYWNEFYETILNITSNELQEQFNKNKDIIDGEIKEIVILKDFNILKQYDKKASYLIELFECIKNEEAINETI